jgi:hypothetical protein
MSSRSTSPNRLRKWASNRVKRRSRSVESFFVEESKTTPSASDNTQGSLPNTTPATKSSSANLSRIQSTSVTRSSQLLQAAVDLHPKAVHTRRPSNSSLNSQRSNKSSDESTDSSKKKGHVRHGSSGSIHKLPVGMSPAEAARSLPSSVKNALGNHAQSESMGYLVLLPHEVVLLNDVHPFIPY